REALEAEGLSAADFLASLFFYDGSASECGARRLAGTERGSRVVFVCAQCFRAVCQQQPVHAEAAIIYEALHTLGLGENPPTGEEITGGVVEACRRCLPLARRVVGGRGAGRPPEDVEVLEKAQIPVGIGRAIGSDGDPAGESTPAGSSGSSVFQAMRRPVA